jgi:hypothetical protein
VDRKLNLGYSDNVHGGSYDEDTGTLRLDLNGGTWDHFNVPPEVVDDLENAPSHGQHYAQVIKPRKYETKRVR